MALVKININTTRGYDTKYLFPGSLPHTGGRTHEQNVGQPQPHKWDYSHDVTGSTPRQNFIAIGIMYQTSGGTDLVGPMGQWESYGTGGDIRLAYVQILNDPETFYTEADITSFSSLTPDNLVETLLADGQTAKLQFNGYTGDDTLRGSYWHDEFNGGKGADRMIGRFGDDILSRQPQRRQSGRGCRPGLRPRLHQNRLHAADARREPRG